MAANVTPVEYDIFLSYAREERAWVEQYLYQPLLGYHTVAGRHPKIFFDVDEIASGENWLTALGTAIKFCRKAVLVYSKNYFDKKMTNWELTKLVERDPTGEERLINPILIDIKEKDRVPFVVSHINYITHHTPDWFSRLCRALKLSPAAEKLQLRFLDELHDTTIQHTLPPVRVSIATAGGRAIEGTEVVLGCETEGLHGKLKVNSNQGIATFDDLLFDKEQRETRLTAWAEGCEKVTSSNFAVSKMDLWAKRVRQEKDDEGVDRAQAPRFPTTIPVQGNAVFFAGDPAVAVWTSDKVAVYSRSGECRGEYPFSGQLRLLRRGAGLIVLVDWLGKIHLLRADGGHCCWDFADPAGGFTVVGDVAIAGDLVYAGFWNGNLFRLAFNDTATPICVHEAGIQAVAVVGDRVYVGGLDGHCVVYQNCNPIADHMLEPTLWMLKGYGTHVVGLGDEKLYKIAVSGKGGVIPEPLHIAGVTGVWTDGPCPVVVDDRGKGICTGAGLAQAAFQTAPDAVPVSADDRGSTCVFLNSDDSYSLLKDGRMVYSHRGGVLAVAPGADTFALGDDRGLRILSAAEFEQSLPRGTP